MVSYCGIVCSDCPAFQLTRAGDRQGLSELAARLSTEERPLRGEDMACDGCVQQGGRLVPFCRECAARLCGLNRGLANCAHCPEFGCDRLQAVWAIIRPKDARPRLERLRAELKAAKEAS
ncbi:MAG: DUF3795 domain-containing protein [bacterium]